MLPVETIGGGADPGNFLGRGFSKLLTLCVMFISAPSTPKIITPNFTLFLAVLGTHIFHKYHKNEKVCQVGPFEPSNVTKWSSKLLRDS